MLPDQPSGVAAVTSRFAPEAGSIGGEFLREIPGVKDLFGEIIRHRDLGGRNQREFPFVLYVKQVLVELWQLAGPEKRLAVHEKRRQRLGVAVLGCVDVEHEIDQSSFEPRTGTAEDREPRTRDLGCAFKIQNSQSLAEVDVVFRLEIEFPRLAPVVITDVYYLNNEEIQSRPAISVGGPAMNAVSAMLVDQLPTAVAVENTLVVQMDLEMTDRRCAVWGMDHLDTVRAVDLFVAKYLDVFVKGVLENLGE